MYIGCFMQKTIKTFSLRAHPLGHRYAATEAIDQTRRLSADLPANQKDK